MPMRRVNAMAAYFLATKLEFLVFVFVFVFAFNIQDRRGAGGRECQVGE